MKTSTVGYVSMKIVLNKWFVLAIDVQIKRKSFKSMIRRQAILSGSNASIFFKKSNEIARI